MSSSILAHCKRRRPCAPLWRGNRPPFPVGKMFRELFGGVQMGQDYKTILQKDHPHTNSGGHVLEHIVIAETMLGRMLNPGETVHHIDHNKKNNSPDNLLVFKTRADHTLCHSGCQIYKEGDVWRAIRKTGKCEECGKDIFLSNCKMKYKKHYCSLECKMKAEKAQVDTDSIIEILRSTNGNFSKAAKEIGISSSAIIRRLKRRGLPYHSKDYQQ